MWPTVQLADSHRTATGQRKRKKQTDRERERERETDEKADELSAVCNAALRHNNNGKP